VTLTFWLTRWHIQRRSPHVGNWTQWEFITCDSVGGLPREQFSNGTACWWYRPIRT
jgi:hypothetical protein